MPIIKQIPRNAPPGLFSLFGILMISHFIYLVLRCIYLGQVENILWVSHIGTLIGGIGAVAGNRLLISVALVSLAGHHGFWLFDTLAWLFTGEFLFGTTSYLKNADIHEWIQSSNHFFSMPLLMIMAFIQGGIKKNAWVWSSLLFSGLIVLSFFISTEIANVNCAHYLWPGLDALFPAGLDRLIPAFYLGSIIAINIMGNYLPVSLFLVLLFGVIRDKN